MNPCFTTVSFECATVPPTTVNLRTSVPARPHVTDARAGPTGAEDARLHVHEA